jgi:hypothetical protein
MILLQFPLPDILLAQRVNRHWRDIIQGSTKLQEALFFKPRGKVLPPRICYNVAPCTSSFDCDLEASGTESVPEALDTASGEGPIIPNPFLAWRFP